MQNSEPIPVNDKWVDKQGFLSEVATKWLQSISDGVQSSPSSISPQSLTTQSASIGVTPIPLGSVNQGLYRLTYYFRITSPGTTSSLSVSFGWTDGGVACAKTSAAVTTNTTNTTDSNTYMIRSDAALPITYSTTYASTGPAMVYALYVVVERVDA